MRSEAKDLVRAILTRAKELDTAVGKTKLLKLLYLADIEHFRETEDTLTGLRWIFYLYGPWSPDYDGLLEQLEAEGAISKERFVVSNLEGERLSAVESLDLAKVVKATAEYFRTKHLIDTWLERSTPQLLDFVYFETEPMSGAEKSTPLDFSKISKEAPALYRRSRGVGSSEQKAKLKVKFADIVNRFKEAKTGTERTFRIDYGEDFAEALAVLNTEAE